jgi:hypothetical protein
MFHSYILRNIPGTIYTAFNMPNSLNYNSLYKKYIMIKLIVIQKKNILNLLHEFKINIVSTHRSKITNVIVNYYLQQ